MAVIPFNEEFIKHLLKNGQHPFVALTPEEMAKQPGLQKLEDAGPATVLAATNYQLLPNSTAFDVHAAALATGLHYVLDFNLDCDCIVGSEHSRHPAAKKGWVI